MDAPIMRPAGTADLVVLYDGQCAVCTASAGWIRARDVGGRVECVDLQDDENQRRFPSFSTEAVRAVMHGVDQQGRVYVAVDALQAIGRRLPRWRLVAWILGIPGIHFVASIGYRWFARNRYVFNPLIRPKPHEQCTNGSCAVDWDKLEREGQLGPKDPPA